MYHTLVSIDLSDVVAMVSGRQALMYRSITGIPSTGQITPENKVIYFFD